LSHSREPSGNAVQEYLRCTPKRATATFHHTAERTARALDRTPDRCQYSNNALPGGIIVSGVDFEYLMLLVRWWPLIPLVCDLRMGLSIDIDIIICGRRGRESESPRCCAGMYMGILPRCPFHRSHFCHFLSFLSYFIHTLSSTGHWEPTFKPSIHHPGHHRRACLSYM
jgi:hypothetical protein